MRKVGIVLGSIIAFSSGFGQPVTWKTNGSVLPAATYTFQVSREGRLYAHAKLNVDAVVYEYIPSARNWRPVIQAPLTKLTIISHDLAFAIESNRFVTLSDNFKEKTYNDPALSELFTIEDYCIGPDTAIYLSVGNVGIVRSKDLGRSWDTLTASIGPITYYGLAVDASNRIYAWNNEVVRSTDGGLSWETIYYFHKGDLPAVCKPYGDNVYILTRNGVLYYGADSLSYVGQLWFDEENSYLDIDKTGALFYHPQSSPSQRSLDGGHHWDTVTIGNACSTSSIACDSNGLVYLVAYDSNLTASYIYASTSAGNSWKTLTQLISPITFVGCDPDSTLYARDKDVFYTSTDEGYSWQIDQLPYVHRIYSMKSGYNQELFAVCRDSANSVILGTKTSNASPCVFTSAMPFQDATTPYTTSGRLLSGELWAVDIEGYFSVLELDNTWRNSFVLDVPGADLLTAAATDTNTIIATAYGALYRSTDKGKTFRRVFDLPNANEAGSVITFNPKAIYVLTKDNNVYYSTDKGSTWQPFIIPQEICNDLVSTSSGALYLSTTTGVFRNLSGFSNPFVWEDISSGLKGLNLEHLALRGNKRLYAATTPGTIYYIDLAEATVHPADTRDVMLRMYPNPAHDLCYIMSSLELENASVDCYTVTGTNVLRTHYRSGLDVSMLPNGIYQLILRTKDNVHRTLLTINR